MIDSLYAIVDAQVTERPLELAFRALNAGCAIVQLRAKQLDDLSFAEIAKRIRSACTHAGVPFVVNDRADIARFVGADGLHLGQDDLSVQDARRVVGSMKIGVSTHDIEQAKRAARDGADWIAFGPVYQTRTKERPDPVVGVRGLAEVAAISDRRLIAIGGITPENAGETLSAGADYVAVIAALPRFLDRSD